MPNDPANRVIGYIVTGTTRGIGRALAQGILARGGRLFSLNRRPDHGEGPEQNFSCDLSQARQVRPALGHCLSAAYAAGCTELVLINNAGILEPILPMDGVEDDQIAMHLQTNLAAPIQLISEFIRRAPDILTSRRIINITSGAAAHAYAGWGLYCTAKAGLNMVTACVAREQQDRPSPVTICAVAPGVVDTDMQRLIRESATEDFPLRERFVQFQAEGQLSDPVKTADLILELDFDDAFQNGGIYDLRQVTWNNGRPAVAAVT